MKIEEQLSRQPKISTILAASDEYSALKLIEGKYLPEIRNSVSELQAHANSMKSLMEEAVPTLQKVLEMYGLLNCDLESHTYNMPLQTPGRKKQSFKVPLTRDNQRISFLQILSLQKGHRY